MISVHATFGPVRGPEEVVDDPQLRANDIVVPLEGAGGKLTSTISSPIQVHGVSKVSAKPLVVIKPLLAPERRVRRRCAISASGGTPAMPKASEARS